MFFRRHLLLDGPNGVQPWGKFMADFQIADFEACDPCLKYIAKVSKQKPQWQRHYWQRGRGSSKTTDLGSNAVWALAFSSIPLDMIVVAEDRDQALFLRKQIEEIVGFNPWLVEHIDVQRRKIVGRHTNSVLESISSDRASSYGLTPHITFADEWSHWTDFEFWTSIYSSFNKRADKGGVIFVSCNAGMGMDWKWTARENFRVSPAWYFSAPDGAAPWYSEEGLKEQRLGMSDAEYQRLWMNRWQASDGGFVTLTEADRCINSDLFKRDGAEQQGWTYVASLDYAEKIDRLVGTVGHRWQNKIIVDRMDVIDPVAYGVDSIPLRWVEEWMRWVDKSVGGEMQGVEFVVDKWQLLSIIQQLRDEGFWIEEFEFKSGIGNYEIGLILRQLILQNRIEWYPGCGEILTPEGELWVAGERNDLCTELAALQRQDLAGGSRWRFQHPPGGHDDRAFGVGVIARQIVMNDGGMEGWSITPPRVPGQFSGMLGW